MKPAFESLTTCTLSTWMDGVGRFRVFDLLRSRPRWSGATEYVSCAFREGEDEGLGPLPPCEVFGVSACSAPGLGSGDGDKALVFVFDEIVASDGVGWSSLGQSAAAYWFDKRGGDGLDGGPGPLAEVLDVRRASIPVVLNP